MRFLFFYFLFFLSVPSLHSEPLQEISSLQALLLEDDSSSKVLTYFHLLKSVDLKNRTVSLDDGSEWNIGRRYKSSMKDWKPKERLKISFHPKYTSNVQIENIDNSLEIWGVSHKRPLKRNYIARLSHSVLDAPGQMTVILNDGAIFRGQRGQWKIRDEIFVFHSENEYALWNMTQNVYQTGWKLVGDESQGSDESVMNLEGLLNKKVLGQQEAVQTVSMALLNAWTGFNDPELPIAVFLFLGPSGVGKTELAKQLTQLVFKDPKCLIRFDMSHFNTKYSITRLIGSSPGYVNHEDGGQLTFEYHYDYHFYPLLDIC